MVNTTLSLGGTDSESDDRYRGQVQLAPERLSTCGPEDAYRWWARSVSQDIMDVAVWSPSRGEIRLAPLMAGGQMPSAEIINQIAAAVLAKKVRPLTDGVQVVNPEPVGFQVQGAFYILTSHAHQGGAIQAQVQKALTAYLAWQRAKLGRAINPSELVARVQAIDGVQRVELSAPDLPGPGPLAGGLGGERHSHLWGAER